MATVNIVLTSARTKQTGGDLMPVADAEYAAQADITSSGSSQQANITASNNQQAWVITAAGGNVRVAFGANPTAAAGAGWLIVDGQTRDFGARHGQKVAVINA